MRYKFQKESLMWNFFGDFQKLFLKYNSVSQKAYGRMVQEARYLGEYYGTDFTKAMAECHCRFLHRILCKEEEYPKETSVKDFFMIFYRFCSRYWIPEIGAFESEQNCQYWNGLMKIGTELAEDYPFAREYVLKFLLLCQDRSQQMMKGIPFPTAEPEKPRLILDGSTTVEPKLPTETEEQYLLTL